MPNLDELYPDAEMGCEKQHGNFVKLLEEPQPCFGCKRPTQWVEINFQAPLCGFECERQVLDDIASLTATIPEEDRWSPYAPGEEIE